MVKINMQVTHHLLWSRTVEANISDADINNWD